MRKEQGMGLITLLLIVISVIAIVCLAFYFTNQKVVDNGMETMETDMLLIQGKLKIIDESVKVNSKDNTLKGTKVADLKEDEIVKKMLEENILGEKADEFYRLGRQELDEMGLNSIKLEENQYYFVHYTDKEVVTNKQIKDAEGNIYHKLSEINQKNETEKQEENKVETEE